MQLLIARLIAEIGKVNRMGLEVLCIIVDGETLGMPPPIGFHELLLINWREVADFEYEIDMVGWNWRWISWIGDLADEAAVLGKRYGEALPRSRGPLVKHAGQNAFILGYGLT